VGGGAGRCPTHTHPPPSRVFGRGTTLTLTSLPLPPPAQDVAHPVETNLPIPNPPTQNKPSSWSYQDFFDSNAFFFVSLFFPREKKIKIRREASNKLNNPFQNGQYVNRNLKN